MGIRIRNPCQKHVDAVTCRKILSCPIEGRLRGKFILSFCICYRKLKGITIKTNQLWHSWNACEPQLNRPRKCPILGILESNFSVVRFRCRKQKNSVMKDWTVEKWCESCSLIRSGPELVQPDGISPVQDGQDRLRLQRYVRGGQPVFSGIRYRNCFSLHCGLSRNNAATELGVWPGKDVLEHWIWSNHSFNKRGSNWSIFSQDPLKLKSKLNLSIC